MHSVPLTSSGATKSDTKKKTKNLEKKQCTIALMQLQCEPAFDIAALQRIRRTIRKILLKIAYSRNFLFEKDKIVGKKWNDEKKNETR